MKSLMSLYESDINIIKGSLPKTYYMLHIPRPTAGGGVALNYSVFLSNTSLIQDDFVASSFEFIGVSKFHQETIRIAVVYHPGNPGTDRDFMEDFGVFFDTFLGTSGRLLACGDVNNY